MQNHYDHNKLLKYIVKSIDSIDFHKSTECAEETVKKAVNFEILVIGECSAKIHRTIRERYSHIPWRQMNDLRNRVIHDFLKIDYKIIDDVIENYLPQVRTNVVKIINQMESAHG